MQLKFFTLPIIFAAEDEDNMNKFLRSVKVLEIKRELVSMAESVYWAVSVLYMPAGIGEVHSNQAKGKIDYKDLLSESEFARFCQFRKIRKYLADSDAVPAYAVFTDAELSEISRLNEISVNSIRRINGIGLKKIEKYGTRFCELVTNTRKDEESGTSD